MERMTVRMETAGRALRSFEAVLLEPRTAIRANLQMALLREEEARLGIVMADEANYAGLMRVWLAAMGRPILAAAAYQAARPARKRVRRQDCLPHLDAHARVRYMKVLWGRL